MPSASARRGTPQTARPRAGYPPDDAPNGANAVREFQAGLFPILVAGDLDAFRRYLGRWEETVGDTTALGELPEAEQRALMSRLLRRPQIYNLPPWPADLAQVQPEKFNVQSGGPGNLSGPQTHRTAVQPPAGPLPDGSPPGRVPGGPGNLPGPRTNGGPGNPGFGLVALTALAVLAAAACSDTGSGSGSTTNVQGGNSRAPGAPAVQATARPTNTVPR